MTEYNNITVVSYNPSNPVNRKLYQEIAGALGTELLEVVPPVLSKQSLEEICGGKLPRVFIHDGSTYENDPAIKNVRKLSKDEMIDHIVNYKFPPVPPVVIYNGRDVEASDALRLVQVVGIHWTFGTNQKHEKTFPFNAENVKRVVERMER